MQINKIKATPAARKQALVNKISLSRLIGSGENGRIHIVDVQNYIKENKIKITPLARRISEDLKIDLKEIKGSGYKGKIVKSDLEVSKTEISQCKIEAKLEKGIDSDIKKDLSDIFNSVEGEFLPLSPMRATIARRMSESYFSAPTFTMNMEVDMTSIKELRSNLLESIKEEVGEKLTVTDLLIMAVGKTLRKNAALNSAWADNKIFRYKDVNIALAVGLDEGLYVPVIKNADKKSLKEIAKESKELARKVKEGKLLPSEQEGNTFTISNVGMYGIVSFTPIINMPSSAILGVGATIDRVVVVNGGYETRPIMTLSLTSDHRVIDGTLAAKFLSDLKILIENPYLMLI